MDQKMVKGVQRQLRGLADAMGTTGSEQDFMLMLQTGAFLMAGCAGISGDVFASMQESAFEDALDAFAMLAKHAAEMMNHPRCSAQSEMADALNTLRRTGEAAGLRGAELLGLIEKARVENKAQEDANRRMEEEWREAQGVGYDLIQKNEKIQADCQLALESIRQLEQQQSGLQARWSEIDADTRRRADEIKEMEQTLERLQSNPQDFSPEREAQLREYLNQLNEDIRVEGAEVRQLEEALQELQAEKYQIMCRRSLIESDILTDLCNVVRRLEPICDDMQGSFGAVKDKVDALALNLEKCRRIQADYEAWLDADGAAMDEIARLLGENDPLNGALRETLDPAATDQLRTLRESTEENLRRMDALLSPCIRAMTEGRRAVLNKVSQGPGGGRG